jgi:hypothetical protein
VQPELAQFEELVPGLDLYEKAKAFMDDLRSKEAAKPTASATTVPFQVLFFDC